MLSDNSLVFCGTPLQTDGNSVGAKRRSCYRDGRRFFRRLLVRAGAQQQRKTQHKRRQHANARQKGPAHLSVCGARTCGDVQPLEQAQRLGQLIVVVEQAALRLKETEPIREHNPEIYFAGFLTDARKEFSEANITLAVISGRGIPRPADLGVDASSFLNGLAEVIGELRRYILDALRRDSFDRCRELMDLMDEIYAILMTVDFPEGVTGGLRHSTDQMRGVLERTRGDLTMALRQHNLEVRLDQWESQQSSAP